MKWWNDLVKWADVSPTLSAIVGGLIVLAVGAIATFVISRIPKLRKRIFGWIVSVARRVPLRVTTLKRRAAALAAEYKRGGYEVSRGVYDSGLADGGRAVTANLTARHEAALMEQERRHRGELSQAFLQGKAARQVELDAERAVPVAQPQWFPEVTWDSGWNAYSVQIGTAWPSGHAQDVTVEADPRIFRFRTAATEQGVPDLVAWHGLPTLAGRAEGVEFTVGWTDSIGDRKSGIVRVDGTEFLEPEPEGSALTEDAMKAAVEAAREEGRQAAEAKAATALPLPDPRWLAYPDRERPGVFVLSNTVRRSVAREVRLELIRTSDFEFHDGAHWEECSGESQVEFRGRTLDGEYDSAVWLRVNWFNEKGVRHRDEIIMPTRDPYDED